MRILDLWATQPVSKRRMRQFDLGVEDDGLPPVLVALCPDGEYEVRDGHHRLAYYRLQGKEKLDDGEYFVIHVDECRRRLGRIDEVIEWNGLFEAVKS
jgi:hypothetical protein